jgi:hypothetical protein
MLRARVSISLYLAHKYADLAGVGVAYLPIKIEVYGRFGLTSSLLSLTG